MIARNYSCLSLLLTLWVPLVCSVHQVKLNKSLPSLEFWTNFRQVKDHRYLWSHTRTRKRPLSEKTALSSETAPGLCGTLSKSPHRPSLMTQPPPIVEGRRRNSAQKLFKTREWSILVTVVINEYLIHVRRKLYFTQFFLLIWCSVSEQGYGGFFPDYFRSGI